MVNRIATGRRFRVAKRQLARGKISLKEFRRIARGLGREGVKAKRRRVGREASVQETVEEKIRAGEIREVEGRDVTEFAARDVGPVQLPFQSQKTKIQEPVRDVEAARAQARRNLMVVQPTSPSAQVVKLTGEQTVEQVRLRQALPALSALQRTVRQELIVRKPEPLPTRGEERVRAIREAGGATGEVRAFVPERDLQKPKTFFGITEPSFKKARELEFKLEKAATTQEIESIRKSIESGGKVSPQLTPEFAKGSLISIPSTFVKAINRPITTTAIVLGALATKGAAGPSLVPTQAGLAATGIAISAQQEQKKGGTGIRTAGLIGALGLIALTGVAAKRISQRARPTKVEFKTQIIEKGKVTGTGDLAKLKVTDRTLIATSKPGAIIAGQKVKGTIKIIERQGFQATQVISPKGKVISEGFRFIEPRQALIQQVTRQKISRTVLSKVTTPTSSRISFIESIKGKVKATIPQGRGTIDINLKLADVAKRDVVATAQVARTRTFKGGQLTSTQPAKVIGGKLVSGLTDITPTKFVFGKEAPVLRDISLAEIGQGQISIIDVKVPRVVESTIITRTGTGTITIDEPSIFAGLGKSFLNVGGSLVRSRKAGGGLLLEPVAKLTPKIQPTFSVITPLVSGLTQPLTTVPLLSFDIEQEPRREVKSRLRSELVIKPITIGDLRPETAVRPITRTDEILVPDVIQPSITKVSPITVPAEAQVPSLIAPQQLRTVTVIPAPAPITTPIAINIITQPPRIPLPPLVPPVFIPSLPTLRMPEDLEKPARPFKQRRRFVPSFTASLFNIQTEVPLAKVSRKSFTGFELRPIPLA